MATLKTFWQILCYDIIQCGRATLTVAKQKPRLGNFREWCFICCMLQRHNGEEAKVLELILCFRILNPIFKSSKYSEDRSLGNCSENEVLISKSLKRPVENTDWESGFESFQRPSGRGRENTFVPFLIEQRKDKFYYITVNTKLCTLVQFWNTSMRHWLSPLVHPTAIL